MKNNINVSVKEWKMADVDLVVDQECGKVYEDIFDLTREDNQPEETAEVERNYPKFKGPEVGKVFNRRSVLLHIRWGNVQGKPTLRVTIDRICARDEPDETLLKFDMSAAPDKDENLKHPKQYVYQALKHAKKQFSSKVGCSVCGKPSIWFKKIKTAQYPLYQVMFKELDFADPDHRINRRNAEFNPVPELDDDGNKFDSIFADSVSEPYTIRRDIQFDNQDYLAALDVHTSNLQLGG
jgi:hypothetical protein